MLCCFCILKQIKTPFFKYVFDFMADFILGAQIPCAPNRYAFLIDLE